MTSTFLSVQATVIGRFAPQRKATTQSSNQGAGVLASNSSTLVASNSSLQPQLTRDNNSPGASFQSRVRQPSSSTAAYKHTIISSITSDKYMYLSKLISPSTKSISSQVWLIWDTAQCPRTILSNHVAEFLASFSCTAPSSISGCVFSPCT